MMRGFKVCLIALAGVVLSAGAAFADTKLQGAGATFPVPIYSLWNATYNKNHPDVTIEYQGVGSGAGITQITAQKVDFAGSDAPLTAAQVKALPAPLLHLPTVAGPVVIAYNIPGINNLNLDGPTLADIYMGRIVKWNDPKIMALNPGVALPAKDITVAHRSDGSGTTFIFTSYLSAVSKDWADNVGGKASVEWPVGVGGAKSDGVSQIVMKTEGGIGYVELAYAIQNKIPFATQINKSGKAIKASIASTQAAAAGAVFPPDLIVSIVDSANPDAYPICGFTYLLVYKDLSYMKDKAKAQTLVDYIDWCETTGQGLANQKDYAALPKGGQTQVEAALKTITCDGQPLLKK